MRNKRKIRSSNQIHGHFTMLVYKHGNRDNTWDKKVHLSFVHSLLVNKPGRKLSW